MQLDRIEAIVRPRNSWESIDLGFSMMQRWWQPLYKVWFSLMLPFFFLLTLLFHDALWIAALLIWWLKPCYDRIILHFLSHALFGEQPNIWQTLTALPKLSKSRVLLALSFGRFDFARSFNLSVAQLENLRGKAASQRIRLLQKSTRNTAVWLTIVCLHFELVLYLSLFGLTFLMLPVAHDFDFFTSVFYGETFWVDFLNVFFGFIGLSIIEPLYVAGGFALYLNRRTHLEGWDIELMFRQIETKLNSSEKSK